ncbi:MAG: hypothetical protein ABIC95_05265 [archaeon]
MNFKIISKEDQPLLSATKVTVDITYDKVTPSRKDVAAAVAKDTGAKPELVRVHGIDTTFGFGKATATVVVYKDEEAMTKVDHSWRTDRVKKLAEKQAAAQKAAAEAKAAEKPKEPAPAAEGKPAEDKPAEAAPVAEKKDEPAVETPKEEASAAEKPVEDKKPESKADDKPAEEKKEKPATDKPAEEKKEGGE